MNPIDALLAGAPTRADLQTWIDSARKAARALIAIEPTNDPITPMLNAAWNEPVRIAVGGHFKTGKSTLLNLVIGRNLLPEDDLPETGAVCELRSGDRDHAVAVDRAGHSRAVACTTDGIRSVVGLIDARGQRRSTDTAVERLDITLAGSAIPAGAVWIDTPGINDTQAMNERAWSGASSADVLVWVIGSRQALAQCEVAFLARRVAAAGPSSVVFVLNAFLNEDTAKHWHDFLGGEMLKRIRTKLGDVGCMIGLPASASPLMIPTAARAAGKATAAGRDAEYGGAAVRMLFRKLSSHTVRVVVASRLHRTATLLDDVVRTRTPKAVALRTQANQAKIAHRDHLVAIDRAAVSLRGECKRLAVEAITVMQKDVATFTEQVVALIQPGNLDRSGHYQTAYGNAIDEAVTSTADQLMAILDAAGPGQAFPYSSAGLRSRLIRTLTPPAPSIAVPETVTAKQSAAGGALKGAFLGFLVGGPIGAAVGAGLGGASGGMAAVAKANAQDAAAAIQNARAAGSTATNALARQVDGIERQLYDCFELPKVPTPSDDRAVTAIEDALKAATSAAAQARQLAGPS